MTDQSIQYLSQEKIDELKQELKHLKETKVPGIAKRIDEAKQMGDLSENAEYHAAREEMAWAQGRLQEIEHILDNSELFVAKQVSSTSVNIGTTIVVQIGSTTKEFTVVGPQEADPLKGMVSNESPLGRAFLGRKVGDLVEVEAPAGIVVYKLLEIR